MTVSGQLSFTATNDQFHTFEFDQLKVINHPLYFYCEAHIFLCLKLNLSIRNGLDKIYNPENVKCLKSS